MTREALHHLQKARELWAEDDGIYNHFGVAYWMLGRDSEAVEQYKIALKINPSNALSHSNMGVVLLRMGKVDEAEKHLREAVRLGIKYPQAHFYLAEILRQKGFPEEAEEHYQKAYRLLDKIIVAK
jgi:tetratricopeptide (TPR) repeat protein